MHLQLSNLTLVLTLTLPLAGLLPGCGGCGGRPVPLDDVRVIEDLGLPLSPDLWPPDAPPRPPDLQPWPDLWSPPDATPPDAAPPDAPPLKGVSVVYAVGPSSYALTLKRSKLDGTGKQTVAGVPTSISFTTLYPTGSLEYAAVSRHRPTSQDHITATYRGVHLPGGRGTLYYFQLNSGGGRGFLQIWPSGKVTLLGTAAGYSTSQETYNGHVAVKQDGALFAAVRAYSAPSKAAVVLFRTDGKLFAGGTTSCDVTPKATQLLFIEIMTITVAKSHVYFAARPVGGYNPPYALFRAPLDCSAKASEVKLPPVYNNSKPAYVGLRMVTSEDGSKLALAAGASKKSTDIVVVDDASGAAVKVSTVTTVDPTPGIYTMRGTAGVQLALSPSGKRIAWVADPYYSTAGQKVLVRPTDMSAQAAQVLTTKAFDAKIKHVPTIQWANDDDLLFWAGEALVSQELYSYSASSGVVANLTATGDTTQPYSGGGKLIPRGGWIARNDQWIYFLQYRYDYPKSTCDLRAVSRKTLQLKEVTQGLFVTYDGSNLEAAEGSPNVFFFARPPGPGTSDEVYVFNQDSATKAQQLTNIAGGAATGEAIAHLMPEVGGLRVAFHSGASVGSLSLRVVEVGPPAKVSQALFLGPGDRVLFSPDGKHLAFGRSGWTQSIVSYDLAAGKSKNLDSSGAGSVFAVGAL